VPTAGAATEDGAGIAGTADGSNGVEGAINAGVAVADDDAGIGVPRTTWTCCSGGGDWGEGVAGARTASAGVPGTTTTTTGEDPPSAAAVRTAWLAAGSDNCDAGTSKGTLADAANAEADAETNPWLPEPPTSGPCVAGTTTTAAISFSSCNCGCCGCSGFLVAAGPVPSSHASTRLASLEPHDVGLITWSWLDTKKSELCGAITKGWMIKK
jgi:hypothetical protein